MLANLPEVCQVNVLRFLDEETLTMMKTVNRKMFSKIKSNRNRLVERTYSAVTLNFSMMHLTHSSNEELLVFMGLGKKRRKKELETWNRLLVLPHNSKYVVQKRGGARSFTDITHQLAVLDGERVYEVTNEVGNDYIEVLTDDILHSLQWRMKEALTNAHIESLNLINFYFSTEVVERLLLLLKINKMRVIKVVLSDPTFEEYDMGPLIRLLRHVAAPELEICITGQSGIADMLDEEFRAFMPSLRKFDCGNCTHGRLEYRVLPSTLIEIAEIAPTTILPPWTTIDLENFRKIFLDWFHGRFRLKRFNVSISHPGLTEFVLAEFLGLPHEIIPNSHELIIVGTTGEQCVILVAFYEQGQCDLYVRTGDRDEYDDDEDAFDEDDEDAFDKDDKDEVDGAL